MNAEPLREQLARFARDKRFTGTGALSVALVVLERVKGTQFPIDPDALIAERSGGQVIGLSKEAVQKVLKRHGITKILSKEAGRTNRGSINNMRSYVALLNDLHRQGILDFQEVEIFWIAQVELFFAGKPFKLRVDPSQGLRMVVRHVLEQALERQKQSLGTQYAGAVLQHLVGAKLSCALAGTTVEHHSFSTSDLQTSRAGDFLIGDTAIHVTTTPSESVVQRCKENIDTGLRPVIVTTHKGAAAIEQLAENIGIASRIDVFEIEQFVALNVYELGSFETRRERDALDEIIERYNSIVRTVETDPSLCIDPN